MNLAKYRKVQLELEDAEERADMAENTLAKFRAKNRASSVVTSRSSPVVSIPYVTVVPRGKYYMCQLEKQRPAHENLLNDFG